MEYVLLGLKRSSPNPGEMQERDSRLDGDRPVRLRLFIRKRALVLGYQRPQRCGHRNFSRFR